jgi:hypothetical protein
MLDHIKANLFKVPSRSFTKLADGYSTSEIRLARPSMIAAATRERTGRPLYRGQVQTSTLESKTKCDASYFLRCLTSPVNLIFSEALKPSSSSLMRSSRALAASSARAFSTVCCSASLVAADLSRSISSHCSASCLSLLASCQLMRPHVNETHMSSRKS